jgi:hypothetical protein
MDWATISSKETTMRTVQCVLLIACFTVFGCGVAKEIKQARKELKKVKEDTKARLDALQVRGEMDFELQDAFKTYEQCYQQAWKAGPVTGWSDLAQAESALSISGLRLADVKKKGIVPVFNLPAPTSEKQKAEIVIGYAPTLSPETYWILLADGKFDKVPKEEAESFGAGK